EGPQGAGRGRHRGAAGERPHLRRPRRGAPRGDRRLRQQPRTGPSGRAGGARPDAYPSGMDLTSALVAALPKVALHDHLDGGLRSATVLELSRELGLPVPGVDAPAPAGAEPEGEAAPGPAPEPAPDEAAAVADWFHAAADSGSLPEYLSTFEHTVALMQTAPQLRRIAREFVED